MHRSLRWQFDDWIKSHNLKVPETLEFPGPSGRDHRTWLAYIAGTYSNVPDSPSDADRLIYFLIYAVIGILFSPIGQELLYRGIAHESIASRLGNRGAALVDAGAFAAHPPRPLRIMYIAGAWTLLPLPALLWVVAMFLSSIVLYAFRVLTGSILGAIVAHAAFNLAMTYVILYSVLA